MKTYEVTVMGNEVPGTIPAQGLSGFVVYHHLGSHFVSATVWTQSSGLWTELRQDQYSQPVAVDENRCLMPGGISTGYRIRITAQ